ncbi:hypothetical protein ACSSS7_007906 [Eimeria intestinalis]
MEVTWKARDDVADNQRMRKVDTSQAISSSELRLRGARQQRRSLRAGGVLRVALIAAAIAATSFLVLSCFRQATTRVHNPSYRRGLSEDENPLGEGDPPPSSDVCQSGESPAGSSEGGQQTRSPQTSQGPGSPQQDDGATGGAGQPGESPQEVPMESAEGGPERPPQGPPEEPPQGPPEEPPQGPPEEPPQNDAVQAPGAPTGGPSDVETQEGGSSSTGGASASGEGEGKQEQPPPPPSPPRKRKRKVKHLGPVRDDEDEASTSAAAPAPAQPGKGAPIKPGENLSLRFANLSVLGRLVSQALAEAKKALAQGKGDLEGRLLLLRLFESFLRKDLGILRSDVATVKLTPTCEASFQFAEKILQGAQGYMLSMDIPPSWMGPEEVEAGPLMQLILETAYSAARMRFGVKAHLEGPTERRRQHLERLLETSSGLRSKAQEAVVKCKAAGLEAAKQMLHRELVDLADVRALAASTLAAGAPTPPPPPPPAPLPTPAPPARVSEVETMAQNMMLLAQSLQAMMDAEADSPPGLFQLALAGLVSQAMEMLDTARSIQMAGVLTTSEATAVATAITVLEEILSEALARQT